MGAIAYKGNIYGGATTLEELTDVNVNEPSDGQMLKYDEENEKWVNDDLSKSDVGLGNVDNTSDDNKPISNATAAAIAGSKTATGSIVTVTDAAPIYAEQVDVAVVATQSGSGTPSPSNVRPIQGYDIVSVDRCGKNLFDGVLTNGIVNTGGSYSTAATRVTNVSQTVDSKLKLTSGSYTISSTTLNDCTVVIKSDNGTVLQDLADSWHSLPYTFTVNQDGYLYFTCRKTNNPSISIDGQIIQVEEGLTATTYEPYNGQTVSLQLGNKNLLPMTVDGIKAANTTGTWSGNVYTVNNATFTVNTDENGLITGIKINTNGAVTTGVTFNVGTNLSYNAGNYILSTGDTLPSGLMFAIQTESGNVTVSNANSANVTNKITNSLCWIYIPNTVSVSNYTIKPMLRSATVTDPTFSPYNPTLGGMVYGGQLTLKDDGSAVFVGDTAVFNPSDCTINKNSGSSDDYLYYVASASMTELSADRSKGDEWKCSHLQNSSTFSNAGTFYPSPSYNVCYLNFGNAIGTNTVEGLKTYCASNNVQIMYKLATPFILYLSADKFKMLQGLNNVSSNGSTIYLDYQPDNVIAEPKADVQRLRDDVDDRLVGNACRNISYLISLGAYDTSTGADPTYSSSNSDYASCKKVPCKKGESFSVSSGIDIKQVIDYYWDNAGTYLGYYVHNFTAGKYFSFESQHDGVMAVSIRAMAYKTSVNDFLNFQIERGSSPTAYEEYYPSNRELWEQIDAVNVPFTGATSSADGAKGLVPAPTSSNREKYLKADGTWGTPTNNAVTQTSSDSETPFYRVLLSGSSNDTTKTEGARKAKTLRFKPLSANMLIGYEGSTKGKISFYTASNSYYVDLQSSILTDYREINLPDATGTVTVSGSSSIKTKKNITDMTEEEASKLLSLRPVNYDYKKEENGTDCYGFIAEEVQELGISYPVFTMHDDDLNEDIPALDYAKFVPYLVKVVQMQQKQIDMLKSKML